jgi:alginate O-acetyltransferase complex protein AlgJ
MALRIRGAVDNSRNFNTLGGWAQCVEDTTRPVEIYALLDGAYVGKTTTILLRGGGTKCGFLLTLQTEISPVDVKEGRIRVLAKVEEDECPLEFIKPMLDNLEARYLGKTFSNSGDDVARHFVSGLTMNASTPYLQYLAKAAERVNQKNQFGMLEGAPEGELSSFLLPVGLRSSDGVSVVGRGGHLFVLGGSNNLVSSYNQSREDGGIKKLANDWIDILRSRSERLAQLNAKYLQLMIPDKSSVLPEYFPLEISSPTTLLAAINDAAAEDASIARNYVDVSKLLSKDFNKDEIFQKTDSHLAAYGCSRMIDIVTKWLGEAVDFSSNFSRRKLSRGDLSRKYADTSVMEHLKLPAEADFARFESGLSRQEFYIPEDSNNAGTRVRWTNDSAPLALRVVAFANSFFERGGNPTTLSWWAARCFKEFHFLWSSNIEYDYVEKHRPDLVICQTVERFLHRVAEE